MATVSVSIPFPQGKAAAKPFTLSRPELHKDLLLQLGLCIAPLPPAFYIGQPGAGGRFFALSLAVLLLYHALKKHQAQVLVLLIGSIPLVTLLRGTYMPYNVPVVTLGAAVLWVFLSPGEFGKRWRRKDMLYVIGAATVYWLISLLLTGRYETTLRSVECAFCAAVILMLSDRRSYLATALLGFGLSAITQGLMLLPYGERLGMGYVPGMEWRIGNPIQLGVSTAFTILLCMAERGRWILLEERPFWRIVISGGSAILLALSTSRGGWFVAILGVLLITVFDKRARTSIFVSVAISVGLVAAVAASGNSRFDAVVKYFTRTFSSETSLEKKTTGRIDQWRAIPEVMAISPIWGFGPGTGRSTSLAYSGKNIIWHSLYLQIAAETGLIGLTLLGLLLWALTRKGWTHFQCYGELMPLIATVSFMTMGLSVSAIDILGGTMLGMGFIATNGAGLFFARRCRINIVEPGQSAAESQGWEGVPQRRGVLR